MIVTLEWHEVMLAAGVGMRRHIAALRAGRPDRHGFNGQTGWTIHAEGACGEMAIAKALGLYWNGSVDTFKSFGDVGALQVRTRSRPEYELIVRPDDSDDDTFVLITGTAPTFTVVGAILGGLAKRDEWLQDYGGRPAAYFVPHSELVPLAASAVAA